MTPAVILLVEDNPDDIDLTRRGLKNVSNRLDVAHDGVEAIAYLKANPLPVVVILDLKLPKIDGLGVLRWMRGNEPTRLLPVVILTTSTEQREQRDRKSVV